ncbi:MAG: hypothetical protein SF052_17645 [Bacteroidia bacterium]|nr:hypothetical protein [Bacteroidia bacterium]
MRYFFFTVVLTGFSLLTTVQSLTGQPHIRSEDHFWRKRVVNRISLVEKINQPLIRYASAYYSGENRFTETDGIVQSLVNGLKKGKYQAYDPDDWKKILNYEDVLARMVEFDQALMIDDSEEWEDEDVEEAFDKNASDEWVYEETSEQWASPFETDPQAQTPDPVVKPIDFAPYEEVIHMVEDWIFDKNTSTMVKQIDYFEVIWADPTGALPEKVLARFMWEDVKDQLDQTQWKSRFNDAESRSVKEVFDLRIFHSFMINVGGNPVISISEAERRRQELVEFEHHLWNY